MPLTALREIRWLPWVLGAHWLLIVGGVLSQRWLFVPFCLWTESRVLQLPGGIIWLVLTMSPLFGLAAIKFTKLRPTYLALAIATPLFFALVLSLNAFDLVMCDAP